MKQLLFTDIAVVIPSRDRRAMLEVLLGDLLAAGIPGSHILIVDNGDTHDWDAMPSACWTKWDGPRNISAWWNVGVDAAAGRPLLVLNDDVRLGPSAVRRLLEALNDSQADIAHPDLSRELKTWQTVKSVGEVLAGRNLFHRLTGWCFLMRTDTGLRLDEQFEWWYGDDDLEWRARAQNGVVRVGGVDAEHLDGDGWRKYGDELGALAAADRPRFVAKWNKEPW